MLYYISKTYHFVCPGCFETARAAPQIFISEAICAAVSLLFSAGN
jgi:hypothetical protein